MTVAVFILTMIVGAFAGATAILGVAYLIDSRQERVIMQRAQMVALYATEYDVSITEAYHTLRKLNFVL